MRALLRFEHAIDPCNLVRRLQLLIYVRLIDAKPAVLIPGRTDDGQLDLPAVRAATERMAIATLGGLD